jgi:cyclopropane fatty-acyl-phospholipid synthase-like methyltransferase
MELMVIKNILICLTGLFFLFSCTHHRVQKHNQHKNKEHHYFSDAKKWEKVFESRKRDEWQKPDEVIKTLKIKKTDLVVDIGSATGYFPVRLAKISRRVWGVDIEPNLVNFLNARAREEKLANLFSILGTEEDPMIPERVDLILLVNTYHHIDHRTTYFVKQRKKMTDGARIVIIDFKKGDLPVGPKHMKLSKSEIVTEMDRAGFRLKADHNTLPYQYFLEFEKF